MMEDIFSDKLTKPRSRITTHEVETVFVNLIRLGDLFQKKDDEFFRPFGLSGAQYNVLRILEGAGEPLPQQEIAKRLLVSRANVTGLIDKLESSGFVERCSTKDRRVNLILLTERGFDFLEETHAALLGQCEQELKGLSPAERKELNGIASKLLRQRS